MTTQIGVKLSPIYKKNDGLRNEIIRMREGFQKSMKLKVKLGLLYCEKIDSESER